MASQGKQEGGIMRTVSSPCLPCLSGSIPKITDADRFFTAYVMLVGHFFILDFYQKQIWCPSRNLSLVWQNYERPFCVNRYTNNFNRSHLAIFMLISCTQKIQIPVEKLLNLSCIHYITCLIQIVINNIGWLAMKFCTDIRGVQRMNPNTFGDPVTPWGSYLWFWMKYLNICWMDNNRYLFLPNEF